MEVLPNQSCGLGQSAPCESAPVTSTRSQQRASRKWLAANRANGRAMKSRWPATSPGPSSSPRRVEESAGDDDRDRTHQATHHLHGPYERPGMPLADLAGCRPGDLPPVAGVVGRDSGEVRLEILGSSGGAELNEVIDCTSPAGTTVHTDEWAGERRVDERHGRAHRAVDHSGPRSARALDLDGNWGREVHCDTQEGLRTGLRDFLRPSRFVSEHYRAQYVAIF